MADSTGKMKAVRFHGRRDLRLDEIDIPQCGPGKVKVKPAFAGICGSDLHEYLGGPNLTPHINPHPITGEKVPLTFGHEFSGIVEEVGSDVKDIKVGDRVVIQPIIYDGTCGSCKAGLINCCDQNGFVGLSGWGGGLSEHCVIPRDAVYKIPDSISLEIGALVEPIAVAWHAVKVSPFKEGDAALVLGGGPIGLAVVQTLLAKGCKKIIVSEISERRKQYAKEFGAHYVLDPTKEDIVARCKELCDGLGPDVGFDAAGVEIGVNQAIKAIRARGTLVEIAVWEKAASLELNAFLFREKSLMGIATYVGGDFQEVIDAIESGKLKPESMITKTIKLNEVEEEGFKTLINDKDNHVKILIDVNA